MTTNNNQTQSNAANQPKNMKLIGTVFSYGGRQASTGNLITTFVVSNAYEAGKNADGSPKLEWNKVLEASLIIADDIAKELVWEEFQTKNGKKGLRARVSFYGSIDIDRREQEAGKPQEFKFWLNPLVRDGRQMVFSLVKRAAPAAAAVPGDNAPKATAAARVKAATGAKRTAAVKNVAADAALPY